MKKILCVTLAALAACSRGDSRDIDSTLAADLALAASQARATQPQQFLETAPAPEKAATAPARSPSRIESAPRTRVVPRQPATRRETGVAAGPTRAIGSGASFALASQQRICTSTNRPGDRFVATLTRDVTGAGGAIVPAGTSVVLEVVGLDGGSGGSDGSVRLAVRSLDVDGRSYPVSGDVHTTSELERERVMSDPNADRKKVIGGAIAGAIVGRVMGKGTKGTVIGAAAGAATGAAAAKATQKHEGCLPVGGTIRMTLAQALVL